jgi:hypothetical protein
MLDGIPGRRFLVEPAREDPAELAVSAAHIQLHEGAGQLLDLPRLGRLAGAEPHDRVADPHRLAGAQGQIARLAVALVEEAKHGDTLRHRRGAGCELVHRLRDVDRLLVLDLGITLPVGIVCAPGRAGGERERRREAREKDEAAHRDQSGVQA